MAKDNTIFRMRAVPPDRRIAAEYMIFCRLFRDMPFEEFVELTREAEAFTAAALASGVDASEIPRRFLATRRPVSRAR